MVTGLRRRLLQLAPLFVLLAGPALAQVPSSPTLQFPYTQPPAEGVGDALDQPHVMVDDKDREAMSFEAFEQDGKLRFLAQIETCRGLVEQKQVRTAR